MSASLLHGDRHLYTFDLRGAELELRNLSELKLRFGEQVRDRLAQAHRRELFSPPRCSRAPRTIFDCSVNTLSLDVLNKLFNFRGGADGDARYEVHHVGIGTLA